MDKTLKTKWINALLSGSYGQTTGQLQGEHGYCCIGVLCDISDRGEWDLDGNFNYKTTEYLDSDGYNSITTELEWDLLAEWGFDVTEQGDLITMNDEENLSFGEIAEWIKENL